MFQLSFVSVTVGGQVTNQKYSSVLTVSDHIFHLTGHDALHSKVKQFMYHSRYLR